MAALKNLLQLLLGLFLLSAGTSHLGANRQEFQAQVPTYLPFDPDFVVVASGVVEIALGLLLILTLYILKKYRRVIGLLTAVFFTLIFAGNINQYLNKIDAFSLDTDQKRLIRLFFQPPLVILTLWVSSSWSLAKQVITPLKR